MAVVREIVSLVLLGALSACAPLFGGAADPGRDAASQQAYRARMEKEVEVVVAVPGAKVCRQLTVGIGNREWVRGAVVEAGAGSISVRIDDPGQYLHTFNGVELRRGAVVRDTFGAWTPCL
jgi:hypothetical protein